MPTTAALMPVIARRIDATLRPAPYESIFVDDGSSDDSFARLKRIAGANPGVKVISLARHFGQHPAMHAGLVRARGETIVTMDGDLQNQPEDIPRLLAAVDAGADVASGRRAAIDYVAARLGGDFARGLGFEEPELLAGAGVVGADISGRRRRRFGRTEANDDQILVDDAGRGHSDCLTRVVAS